MISKELYITGKVQGVFYRATAKEIADKLGITGEIENLRNGDVKARVTGEPAKLEDFITWCRQGPVRAVVDGVSVSEIQTLNFPDFKIIR